MTPECERNAKDADRVSVGWAQRFWPVLGRQAVLRADGQHQAVDAPRRTAAEGRAAEVIGDVEGGAEKGVMQVERRGRHGAWWRIANARFDGSAQLKFQILSALPETLGSGRQAEERVERWQNF